jgi:hypothetical protein
MQRLTMLLPKRKKALARVFDSEAPSPFMTTFEAPLKRRSDFRKAVEIALPQLMPIKPDDLLIYGRRVGAGVELAAFRREEMAVWMKVPHKSSGAAVHVSETWIVLPPASEKIAARRRFLFLLSVLIAVGALVVAYVQYSSALNRRLSGLLAEEQLVRAAALVLARQREEADLWSTLDNAQAPARLPAAVMGSIAELSRLTPSEAAWTRLEWSPSRVIIAGFAVDPVAVLAAVSAVKGAKAEFSKPMVGKTGARSEFEIQIAFEPSRK